MQIFSICPGLTFSDKFPDMYKIVLVTYTSNSEVQTALKKKKKPVISLPHIFVTCYSTLLSKLHCLKFYNSAKIELNTIWTLATWGKVKLFKAAVFGSQRQLQKLSEQIGLNIFTDPFCDDKAAISCAVQHSEGLQISQPLCMWCSHSEEDPWGYEDEEPTSSGADLHLLGWSSFRQLHSRSWQSHSHPR